MPHSWAKRVSVSEDKLLGGPAAAEHFQSLSQQSQQTWPHERLPALILAMARHVPSCTLPIRESPLPYVDQKCSGNGPTLISSPQAFLCPWLRDPKFLFAHIRAVRDIDPADAENYWDCRHPSHSNR